MGPKIDFFKVRDIVTPIQPRKKEHQTNVSSALKTFEDHLRRLWDDRKNMGFWDYLRDAASDPKTFLGPN